MKSFCTDCDNDFCCELCERNKEIDGDIIEYDYQNGIGFDNDYYD